VITVPLNFIQFSDLTGSESRHSLACLNSITKKLSNLESMLSATQPENKQLKEVINNQNTQMLELKDRINSLEQQGRTLSICGNHLTLDSTEEKDPPLIYQKGVNTVFLPIRQGAASKQISSQVPSCYEMVKAPPSAR
jgi:hypothetical protein